jgi:hypothetical protein
VHVLCAHPDAALRPSAAHHLSLRYFLPFHVVLRTLRIISGVHLVRRCILVHLPVACHESSHRCWVVAVLGILFEVVHAGSGELGLGYLLRL